MPPLVDSPAIIVPTSSTVTPITPQINAQTISKIKNITVRHATMVITISRTTTTTLIRRRTTNITSPIIKSLSTSMGGQDSTILVASTDRFTTTTKIAKSKNGTETTMAAGTSTTLVLRKSPTKATKIVRLVNNIFTHSIIINMDVQAMNTEIANIRVARSRILDSIARTTPILIEAKVKGTSSSYLHRKGTVIISKLMLNSSTIRSKSTCQRRPPHLKIIALT